MKSARKGSDVLLAWLWQYKWHVFGAALLLSLAVIFARVIMPALAVIALGIIASFSTSYKRIIRIPPAIELVTFTTVIVSLAYGPVIGAIYAAVVSIAAEVMTNALDIFIISFVPGRIIIALTAGFFFDLFGGSIIAAGIASTILYNAIAQPFYLFLADVEMRAKSLYFIFVNIGSNIVLFLLLGKVMASLLGIS